MLSSLDFLATDQHWPPKGERGRLDEYLVNRLLFEGEHPQVFNDWYRILREDQSASLEFVFNLFKRLSTLWGDLLVGEPPRFIAGSDDSAEQKACDRIVAHNALPATAYEVALDKSRYGDGLFVVSLDDKKQAVIEGQPPSYWYPIVSRNNLRRTEAHVLAWTFDVTTRNVVQNALGLETTTTYLQVQIHTKGKIEHRLFELDSGKIKREVEGTKFYPDWKPVEDTLVDEFLIVPVPGLRTTDRYFGMDDYGDLIGIVREMEVRVAQISRILDKHADPSMWGPQQALRTNPHTGETEMVAGGNFFPVAEGDGAPAGYITWEGQLEGAFSELERLIQLFYVTSETSPAAFGQLEQGLAESGSALRRLMMAPLAKVNRTRLSFDPALKKAIQVAAALERAHNGNRTPLLPNITIVWRDGLPEDPSEQATVESTRKTAGLTSVYSSIRRLDGGTDREILEEIDRIDEDEARSAALAPAVVPGAISQPPEGRE